VRLALCITELEIGGAERCLAELALRLAPDRFTVAVYSLGPRPANDERSLVPKLEAAGIEVHCLGGRGTFDAPAVAWKLARLLKRQRPEIVQTFLFHANLIGRFAAKWAGAPYVVAGLRVAEWQKCWRLALDRWTSRLVDRYVAVSQSVAAFSQREAGLPAERIAVIPNGIDTRAIDSAPPANLAELGIRPGRRALTYIGRLDPQKGLDELIAHSQAWLARLPEHDLLLVGEGPQRAELEALTRGLGVADRIWFAGWQSDVPAILRASELLLLPSRWEGMPNALLEAMACRLPVVAMDVEGVGELLGENRDEQTAPAANMQVFADKLVAIATSAELRARLGAENRRRVETSFTLDAMAAAYAALYDELVGR
jgi:glycosyltransferase involved in cell wall biosynthesis